MDKNTKQRLEAKFRLKQERAELPRMTREQKDTLLEFLKGDIDSFLVGEAMVKKYLRIYPNEKHFKRKVDKIMIEQRPPLRLKSRRSRRHVGNINVT
jgi:hypothetical protein